jgi:hypothetical protein
MHLTSTPLRLLWKLGVAVSVVASSPAYSQFTPIVTTKTVVPGRAFTFGSIDKDPAQDPFVPGSVIYVGRAPGYVSVWTNMSPVPLSENQTNYGAASVGRELAVYVSGPADRQYLNVRRIDPAHNNPLVLQRGPSAPQGPLGPSGCVNDRRNLDKMFLGFGATGSDGRDAYYFAHTRRRSRTGCTPLCGSGQGFVCYDTGVRKTNPDAWLFTASSYFGNFGFDASSHDLALGNRSHVIRVLHGQPIGRVADVGGPSPGSGGNFTQFFDRTKPMIAGPVIAGGKTTFFGVGTGPYQGIFTGDSPTHLAVVADTNVDIPDGTGRFTLFEEQASAQGSSIAFVGGDGAAQQGIYVRQERGNRKVLLGVVDRNDTFADFGAKPISFHIGRDAVSGNKIAFWANFPSGGEGIYLAEFPRLECLETGQPISIESTQNSVLCPDCPDRDLHVANVRIKSCIGVRTGSSCGPKLWYSKAAGGSYTASVGALVSGDSRDGLWEFVIPAATAGPFKSGHPVFYFITAQNVVDPADFVSLPPGAFLDSTCSTVQTLPTNLAQFSMGKWLFCWRRILRWGFWTCICLPCLLAAIFMPIVIILPWHWRTRHRRGRGFAVAVKLGLAGLAGGLIGHAVWPSAGIVLSSVLGTLAGLIATTPWRWAKPES